MIRYKFSKELNQEFAQTIKTRANAYFQENKICKNANAEMVTKTVMAFSIYIIPYILMLAGIVTSIPVMFAMWFIMGLGMAFIGTSVMHDALHGSYSKKRSVNSLLGISAMMLGVDPTVWKIQHNVLHHTYTNIEDADEDIAPRYVLRFTPHQPRRWFHRYQYLYAIILYGISTMIWVTAKDFIKLYHYKSKGLVKRGAEFRKRIWTTIFRKVLYFIFLLVIPILVFPIPAWTTVLMFMTMHFVAGISLSLVFQPAHVIETSDFVMQEEEEIKENWFVHQILTTSNFAMSNKLVSWFSGGLNYQIEHHLFPHVCHVHYPRLSKILQQTTAEYNLPYYAQRSFRAAVFGHFNMLRELGRRDDL